MSSIGKKNISPITKFSTFIQKYPNQKLHEQFRLLQQSFPSHRAVRGDGNCFYRAFAFLYLVSSPCQNFSKTFPKAEFNYIRQNSKIRSNDQFQQTLYVMWNKYISKLSQSKGQADKQKKLQYLFNQIEIFDEVIIGYFRSKNYDHMVKSKHTLRPFLRDELNFQNELQRVRTFGAQSEQIQIYSISDALDIKITVFFVDQNTFQPIQYNQKLEDKGIYLFFRPGHYDIIYPYYQNDLTPPDNEKAKSLIKLYRKQSKKLKQQKLQKKTSQKQKNQQKQPLNKIKKYQIIKQQDKQHEQQPKQDKKVQKKESMSAVYINSNNILGNDGKYDRKYKSSLQKYAIKSAKSHKPRIIGNWYDPFNRLSIEALGLSVLFIIGYVVYYYTV